MGKHGGIFENIESIENKNMGNMVKMNFPRAVWFLVRDLETKCCGSGECLTTSAALVMGLRNVCFHP